jgi:small subunit ribosomal protein S16
MLVIRLARTGRNKYPTYRIVAAESSRAATGKFVSVLGNYNPHTKELVLKKDEIMGYIKNGAQPSNTVVKLLQREKLELPAWVVLKTKNKVSKQEPVEAAAPAPVAEEAPTEAEIEAEVTETPVEEATPVEAAAETATVAEEAAAEAETSENEVETVASETADAEKAKAGEAAAAEAALEPEAPIAE